MQKLEQLVRSREKCVKNALQIQRDYAKQGVTQTDYRSPCLHMWGTPSTPQLVEDKIVLNQKQRLGSGGGLSRNDVSHFLEVRIHNLSNGQQVPSVISTPQVQGQ